MPCSQPRLRAHDTSLGLRVHAWLRCVPVVQCYVCTSKFLSQLEAEASRKDKAPKKSFEEGQKVEARFRGRAKWFKGKVQRVNRDGTYDIEYEDGDNERDVAADMVRALEESKPAAPKAFEEGQTVEGRFKGGAKWFKATITRVNRDGTYDLTYEDGDKERDVAAEHVRQVSILSCVRRDRGLRGASGGPHDACDVLSPPLHHP